MGDLLPSHYACPHTEFLTVPPELPDCHSRRIWGEQLLAVLPVSHPLAGRSNVIWADLAGETFLVRHGGTGPQVYDHVTLRLAGRLPPPAIQRFGVERITLLSMVAQNYGVTIAGEATAKRSVPCSRCQSTTPFHLPPISASVASTGQPGLQSKRS
ncbi:LysR substrate-binding domain-containing protein [Aureimonas altamirensis]|uniref:LysR substrate-binding domain-containing protein n=1 Tax=Aureimonas altamirensis TaxID=370622 RepID=UPI003EBDCFCC